MLTEVVVFCVWHNLKHIVLEKQALNGTQLLIIILYLHPCIECFMYILWKVTSMSAKSGELTYEADVLL